jgi:hypothetical protein
MVKTLALMSSSYDWTLCITPNPRGPLPRHSLCRAKVCESTMGEYLRPQQALTIGWK